MNGALERKTLEAVRRLGVARPRDLTRLGLPREYVQRLVDRGALVRVARGLYADPDAPMSALRSLAESHGRFLRASYACSARSSSIG